MTRIASHRGGTLEFGDSTPAGFSATAAMALEEVEFDVHPTADGAIIVHHDPTLDRTTDRSGIIAEMTSTDVRAATIDYSGGSHPLTLEELCALFENSPVAFRCEFKPGAAGHGYRDFVPRVIETLAANGRLETTVFSSFLLETLIALQQSSDQPFLWLVSPPVLHQLGVKAMISVARQYNVPEIGLNIDTATPEIRDALVSEGIAFGCWAAHSAQQIEKALALGAKVFTTDRPSLAIAVREAWRLRNQEISA
ncbi:glycerophosphodiester phosphodiesterase family protein [Devosia pacifica]|uniref:glycerophosphodiester phosphodiesterase family protein n=1 Tax=Devosia pacifica TaxID=1335967 RepID=UPI001AED4D3A|nr:glycerophosphodiester phosphodiesterase family protein [Devosia pacifica]